MQCLCLETAFFFKGIQPPKLSILKTKIVLFNCMRAIQTAVTIYTKQKEVYLNIATENCTNCGKVTVKLLYTITESV